MGVGLLTGGASREDISSPALGVVSCLDSQLPDWESDALTSGAAETIGTGNTQG
jgi:hypothetical protein